MQDCASLEEEEYIVVTIAGNYQELVAVKECQVFNMKSPAKLFAQ